VEENKVIDVDLDNKEVGEVQIADDVIAVIAEIAALEVEGVYAIAGNKNDIVQTIRGKKASKGMKIEVSDHEVFADLSIVVQYGVKIQEVCLKVQEKVKNSIETMTGLDVQSVDVHVVGVDFSKTKAQEEH
jgi:uncharacterized alkaline shock family protein YloU